MMRFGKSLMAVGVSLFSAAAPALAHGGHDPRLKVSVSENEVRVETSLEAEAFMQFDTNGDGQLTAREFESQYAAIARWIDANVRLDGGGGEALTPYFSDSPIVDRGHMQDTDAVENVKVLRRYKLQDNPGAHSLVIDFYEHSPQILYSRSGSLDTLFKFDICVSDKSADSMVTCARPL